MTETGENLTESNKRALAILLASLLVLANSLLHAHVYGNRNYREDEINTIHVAQTLTAQEIALWLASDVHPPGWRLGAAAWVQSFGTAEAVVRWSSKLINLISFALVFQLGTHLFDRRVGLYAVALLGLYGFASNSMYELRPYALLIALTTGLHLVFLRWLTRPTGKLMVAYVWLGVAAVYTHFFAFIIFVAHALFMVALRRLDRNYVYRTVGLWILIAVAFAPWILPLAQTATGSFSGGYYAVDVAALVEEILFRPAVVFELLVLASLVALHRRRIQASSRRTLRWYPLSRLAYPVFLLLATFAVVLIVNEFWSVLNARGFTTVVMLIALMMALGLWLLPTNAGVILLFILYLHAPANIFVQPSNAPYREIVQEMSSTYETDSIVVTEFSWAWRWLQAAAYFLMNFTPDEMSKDRMYHLVDPHDSAHPPTYPDQLVNIFRLFHPETFGSQLSPHSQLWHLSEGDGNDLGGQFIGWLNQHYALIRSHAWDEPYDTNYRLSEYAKAPEHQGPLIHVGDPMRLYSWALEGSVEVAACQSVTVESWWQLETEVDVSYSLGIILAEADGDGQVAIQDSIPAEKFTTEWQTDRFYRDRTTLQIPCVTEAGSYNLLLAAKEMVSGAILPLRYADGTPIGREFYLTTLRVG